MRDRYRLPAHPVEAIASGDEVAAQLDPPAAFGEFDVRAKRFEISQLHAGRHEADVCAPLDARGDQIFDHLLLPVYGDVAAGQPQHVDVLGVPRPPQVDPGVSKTLPVQAITCADAVQNVDRVLLQQTGPNPAFHIVAVPALDHRRLDPALLKQQSQGETSRSGADYAHLGG
jgi:hypothetical protein